MSVSQEISLNEQGRTTRTQLPQVPAHSISGAAVGNAIVVTDSDVLSGRGISIAKHNGNLRFRKLVSSHYDDNYCKSYKTIEKRAVADKIIAHIQSLNPPGRFLKRASKSRSTKLDGPWEELTYDDALKKTVQALRDANREDREGYAAAVPVPEDVMEHRASLERQGLTNRQFAKIAAADFVNRFRAGTAASSEQAESPLPVPDPTARLPASPPDHGSTDSALWKNSNSPGLATAAALIGACAQPPSVTPATAGRPSRTPLALFEDDRKMPAREPFFRSDALPPSPGGDAIHHHSFQDSPQLDSGDDSFANAFKASAPTSGPSLNDDLDLMAARAAAGLDDHHDVGVGSLHHDQHAADNFSNLFQDVDDDVDISTAHAFGDQKF